MKIMIVDDEEKLRLLLEDMLSDEGYSVVKACNGAEALEKFKLHPDIGLIILDVMMPVMDGYRVVEEIRKVSKVPVIMLTARSQEADELESFDKGATDYISKPFSLAVLMARVKARLNEQNAEKSEERIAAGEIAINKTTHEVTLAGAQLELTPIEYELLLYFCTNADKVHSREKLLSRVWGYDYYGGDRTVDTHVGRLRLKLGKYGDSYVRTVRGYGYKFSVQG